MTRIHYTLLLAIFAGALLLPSCWSGSGPGAPENETLEGSPPPPTEDPTLAAPVFMDEKTHEMNLSGSRELLDIYKAIPDQYFPVSGKPEGAIKVNDPQNQYLGLDYGDGHTAAVKILKDTETARQYLVVFGYDCSVQPCRGKYAVLLLKAKHCIDLTQEMLPKIPDGMIRDAWKNVGLGGAPRKPTWYFTLDPGAPRLSVRNAAGYALGKELFPIEWKFGRFVY